MSLIEKEYFTLAEVVEGLGMPWTDVIYLAENGHLRLSVLVFQLPVDWGSCVDQAPTDFSCDPLSLPSLITGLVDLGDTINGLRLALGPRQADVVRQLHEAALAGNPWRNGKELLRNAGSESTRMHDLFKSKGADWSLLIDSDRRGLYRLAIPRGLEDSRRNRRRAQQFGDLVGTKGSERTDKPLGAEGVTLHKNTDSQGSER